MTYDPAPMSSKSADPDPGVLNPTPPRPATPSDPPPKSQDGPLPGEANYESTPLSRSEYIAAIVHLYRGELHRSTAWRVRLDNTTNWAVLTTAGLLTFSFREDAHSHWTILIGLALVTAFLAYEARRFRFSDVWRSRVRKIEENFYGPILRRDPHSPFAEWGSLVAEDLLSPRFKINRRTALRFRFVRNYWAIYGVLILSWVIKVAVHPVPAENFEQIRQRLDMGFLFPWWSALAYLGAFLFGMAWLVFKVPPMPKHEFDQWHQSNGDEKVPDDVDL